MAAEQTLSGHDNSDRALMKHHYEFILSVSGESPTTDLFASTTNSQCESFYTADTDCMKANWCHLSAWANPPFIPQLIASVFCKMEAAYRKAPDTTSFLLIAPVWPGACYNPGQCPSAALFQVIHTWEAGVVMSAHIPLCGIQTNYG